MTARANEEVDRAWRETGERHRIRKGEAERERVGGKEIQGERQREMGEMRRREGLKRETLRDVDQRHRDRIPEKDLPNP